MRIVELAKVIYYSSERICSECEIISKRVVSESNRLLIVIVTVVIGWLLASESIAEKIVVPLSVGLVISYIVAVLASFPPIITIPLSEDEVVRVFSPIAYPFCIQQYRNYDANLFSYTLSFGWPEGLPLLDMGLMDDQSEFIHAAHYTFGLFLGLALLLFVVILVGILTLVERKSVIVRKQRTSSTLLLIALQLILVIQIFTIYLSGNIIYPLGGIIVLIITLYPTLRFGLNRKS
ncbi:MAG: hypothetical protein ACXACG_09520 [Candidatus Thorarchaeota archaeon]